MPTTLFIPTTSPTTSRPHHLDGLNTLRALAIMLVFMYHYMVFISHEATFGWASTLGWSGVDLFFVLSGYLISNPIFASLARGQGFSLPVFYARRALRTLPNFYLILALYFLFPAVMGGKEPPPLWRFLSFTQNLWLTPGTAFSHAWSLCIEEQFYLLLPAVVLLGMRYGKHVRHAWLGMGLLLLCAVATRSVLWLQYGREALGQIQQYYPNIYYSSFCRMDELLPGVALALIQHAHPALWQRLMRAGNKLLLAASAAVALVFYGIINHYDIEGYGYGFFMTGFGYSLIAMAFALLVLAALSPASYLYRVRIPGAAQLALWSYAIYLSHKPLGVIIHRLGQNIGLNTTLEVLIISAVSIACGWLMFTLVETPFMKLRERYFPAPAAVPAALAANPHQPAPTQQALRPHA